MFLLGKVINMHHKLKKTLTYDGPPAQKRSHRIFCPFCHSEKNLTGVMVADAHFPAAEDTAMKFCMRRNLQEETVQKMVLTA